MADYTQFNLRGDTKSNWLNANPVLSDREIALETDTQRFKIGNGTSYYNQLPYGRNTGEYLNFYNVTALAPLTSGNYYTHETAILAVPSSERAKGTIVSYETASGVWYTERFIGSDVANWSVLANWKKVPDAGDIAQLRSDLSETTDKLTELGSSVDNYIILEKGNFVRTFVSKANDTDYPTSINLRKGICYNITIKIPSVYSQIIYTALRYGNGVSLLNSRINVGETTCIITYTPGEDIEGAYIYSSGYIGEIGITWETSNSNNAELQSKISSAVSTENLINPLFVTKRRYISYEGVITYADSDDFYISDFIPVNENIVSNTEVFPGTPIYNFAVYDENRKVLRVVQNASYQWSNGDAYVIIGGHSLKSDMAVYGDILPEEYISGSLPKRFNELSQRSISINDVRNGYPIPLTTYEEFSDDVSEEIKGLDLLYNGSGNLISKSQRIYPNGNRYVHVKFNCNVYSGSLTVWVIGHTTDSSKWKIIKQINTSGNEDISFDPAYYTVYEDFSEFHIWFSVSGGSHVTLANLEIIEIADSLEGTYIKGSNAKEMLKSADDAMIDLNGKIEKVQENVMIAPNGDKYMQQVDNDGGVVGVKLYPEKAVFIGNSILLGNGTFGMNATNANEDYKAKIDNFFRTIKSSYSSIAIHGNSFYKDNVRYTVETATTDKEVDDYCNAIKDMLTDEVDLVIVQLCDNVNSIEKMQEFIRYGCKKLLQFIRMNARKSRVVWVGGWYTLNPSIDGTTYNLAEIIGDASRETGSKFISIAGLQNDNTRSKVGEIITFETLTRSAILYEQYEYVDKMLTVSFSESGQSYTHTIPCESIQDFPTNKKLEYESFNAITNSSGVASHPGNEGMTAIAQTILKGLGF